MTEATGKTRDCFLQLPAPFIFPCCFFFLFSFFLTAFTLLNGAAERVISAAFSPSGSRTSVPAADCDSLNPNLPQSSAFQSLPITPFCHLLFLSLFPVRVCVIPVLSFGNEKYVKLNYDFSSLAPPLRCPPHLTSRLVPRLRSYSLNSFLWEFFIYFSTFVLAKYLTACARSSDEARKNTRQNIHSCSWISFQFVDCKQHEFLRK